MEIPDQIIEAISKAIDAARASKGATREHPKALVNDVFAMLTGGLVRPKPHAESLTETLLGVAIGSLTDLGKSDEVIIEKCTATLARIRAALADPDIVRDALALSGRIK